MSRQCEVCTGRARNVCNQCKVMAYCGTACQQNHWDTHRAFCIGADVDIPDLMLYKHDCVDREDLVRKAQAGELQGIEGKFGDWVKRQAFAAKMWARMRNRKGVENILQEIARDKYDKDQLEVITKVAGRSGRFRSLQRAAEYKLGQLGGQ